MFTFSSFYIVDIQGSTDSSLIGTSTWDTTGGGGSAEWNENAASAATNGETFAEVGEDNFNGGFGGEDGGNAAGTSDTACRRCGKEGHFANDCDQPREFSGACFNCGEEGHSKADVRISCMTHCLGGF